MMGPISQWDTAVTSRLSYAAIPYLTQIVSAVVDYYHQEQWNGIQIRTAMSEILLPYILDVMFLKVNKYYTDLWDLTYQWLTGMSTVMDKIGIHTIYWMFHPLPSTVMQQFHLQVAFQVTQVTIPLNGSMVRKRQKLYGTHITIAEQLSAPCVDGMVASCYYHADNYLVPLWVTLDRVPLTLDDMISTPYPECVDSVSEGTYQIQLAQAITVEGITGSWILFQDPAFLQGWLSYKKSCESILKCNGSKPLPSGPGYWKILVYQDGKWQNAEVS